MQIAGAKGVHLQGQPGAGPRLTLMGLLMGSVWGLSGGPSRCDRAPRDGAASFDTAPYP